MALLKDQPQITIENILDMLLPAVPDDTTLDVWNRLSFELLHQALSLYAREFNFRIVSRRQAVNSSIPDTPTGGTIQKISNTDVDRSGARLSVPPTDWVLGISPVISSVLTELWISKYDIDTSTDTITYSKPYKWTGVNRIVAGSGIIISEDDGEITISTASE